MSTTASILSSRTAPGPRGVPLLGSLPGLLWGSPLDTLLDGVRAHGDVVRFRYGPLHFFVVNHPDYIRHVLQENRQNYRKSVNYDQLRLVVGNGLLTSEGDTWLRQRRLAQPAFHRARLAALTDAMGAATLALVPRWERAASSGETLDVAAEMSALALDIVGRTLFSQPLGAQADAVSQALEFVLRYLNERSLSPLRIPFAIPTPHNLRAKRAIAALDRIVYGIIAARRRAPAGSHDDLLTMLLEARDERTGEGMSDRQLRDEVMTLVLAGHETTANALAWTWVLLSRHPSAAQRLHTELDALPADRAPAATELPKLRYTTMVLEEALRLYPPAWMIERQSLGPDELGGYPIAANTLVAISPYIMHRHPAYWPQPEAFDPERFAPEQEATRPKFAYLPFGGGPRGCIGNGFAMMEAQVVLATLARRFRVDLVPGHPIELEPIVTLRPRHGVRVRLRARA